MTTLAHLVVNPIKGHLVGFARFENGRIKLFEAYTSELEYIAISHVWGDIKWRVIPNVDGERKVSESKANFIATRLPALVGDTAFWMDTLTVDQRNQAEVIATVQAIPTIFREAIRTIAIREGPGIYGCCSNAVKDFKGYSDFFEKLCNHGDKAHWQHKFDEAYLQRLWTLQECFLSHTIEFVVDGLNQPLEFKGHGLDPYRGRAEIERVADSLFALAHSFFGPQETQGDQSSEFIRAYVQGGIISRPKPPPRDDTEDIHTGIFRMVHLASNRCASMPRDYIFATMPQFPWYHYPVKAEKMPFSAIFVDLHVQAVRNGHSFAPRITRSMIEKDYSGTNDDAWLPSKEQPEPKCLGDFLKLLGHRIPTEIQGGLNPVHLTTKVMIRGIEDLDPNSILELIESSMRFSQRTWQLAHKGGELSKHGSFPSTGWELDPVDAMRSGWVPLDTPLNHPHIRVIEDKDANETIMACGRFPQYKEVQDDVLTAILNLQEEEESEPGSHITLLQQSQMVLDHFWCGLDDITLNRPQGSDWMHYKREMRGSWPRPILQTMALLAALVSCGIGLSAAPWMRKHFVPVCVKFQDQDNFLLGVLARHALRTDLRKVRSMWSVGRHPQGPGVGKDLSLVDQGTKLPVGILPDFLPDMRTDELFATRMKTLYSGLTASMEEDPRQIRFSYVSMDRVPARK